MFREELYNVSHQKVAQNVIWILK